MWRRISAIRIRSGKIPSRPINKTQRRRLAFTTDAWDSGATYLKSARTAHRAMIARLAVRFERAGLFFFKKFHQLIDDGFVDIESLLAGMRRGDLDQGLCLGSKNALVLRIRFRSGHFRRGGTGPNVLAHTVEPRLQIGPLTAVY